MEIGIGFLFIEVNHVSENKQKIMNLEDISFGGACFRKKKKAERTRNFILYSFCIRLHYITHFESTPTISAGG